MIVYNAPIVVWFLFMVQCFAMYLRALAKVLYMYMYYHNRTAVLKSMHLFVWTFITHCLLHSAKILGLSIVCIYVKKNKCLDKSLMALFCS